MPAKPQMIPPVNGRNGFAGALPIIVAVVALGVTLMTTLGGFATFRDYVPTVVLAEYKIAIANELVALRRDLNKIEAKHASVDEEQKRRTGIVQSVQGVEKRLDLLTTKVGEIERALGSSYTLNDEIKRLNAAIQELRNKVLVPANGTQR